MSPATRNQRGVSLIEILVALVILVLGILTLIRLFPGGFLLVRSAENSTFADRLGTAAVESLKNNGGGLPDGIYALKLNTDGSMLLDASNQPIADPNVRPDDLNGGSSASGFTYNTNYYTSDINRARYVSNETISVPAGRVVNNVLLPPIHAINFGPIVLSSAAVPATIQQSPGAFEANLSVVSTPWETKAADSRPNINTGNRPINDPEDELSPGQSAYLVDSAAGRIAVPPASYEQAFTLILKSLPSGSGVSSTYTVHLDIPAIDNTQTVNTANNYNGGWIDFTTAPGSSYVRSLATNPVTNPAPGALPSVWVADSTVLYREFHCKNSPQTEMYSFTVDPYEYALVNANFAKNGGFSDANIGTLAFNPLAAGRNGRAPLRARISYLTYDWHIIRDDRDVADGSTIRLTLNGLKKIGDPLTIPDNRVSPSSGIYTGLIADATDARDFFLLDLDTGRLRSLATGDVNSSDDNPADPNLLNISYNAGRIVLPNVNSGSPNYFKFKGGHLRIFYAGDLDWGVAVQKAASLYQRHIDPATNMYNTPTSADPSQPGALHVSEYFIVGDDIYFPLCDAGKTVELDGVQYTDRSGTQASVSDIAQAIPDVSVSVGGIEYVRLNASQLNLPNFQSGMQTNMTVGTVRGLSARAVVIWRERGEWKTRNVDTLLTRTQ